MHVRYMRSAARELSKVTYGDSHRPGTAQVLSESFLIIYIIHIPLALPLPLSLHLLFSSPQIQLPLRLIGKVAISIQRRLWYQWGMQLIWIISLPHVVNNRLTGGRIQRVGCFAHCLLPAVRSGWTLNKELSLTPSLVSLSLLMFSLQHLCYLAHPHMP